jgi:multiple sugar transport system substrate-binding protein
MSLKYSILYGESTHDLKKVTITALLDDLGQLGKKERWQLLIGHAIDELKSRHEGLDIEVRYIEIPSNQTRDAMLQALANGTAIDLVSLDQIWLGEFAQKGLLTDLTNYTNKWGRFSDWYQANWDGGAYNGRVYGIWAWTDIRGLWYWKDLLGKAGIDPNSMRTWDGYIAAAKKLDSALKGEIIQGVHLTGVYNAPDMWYPYLWMLGGDILSLKGGHPMKGNYYFPAYNSTAGVKALSFLKRQVDVGVKPQTKFFDTAFAHKKFAVMLGGSWMPGEFSRREWPTINKTLGFMPVFPVPNKASKTATMMGGWELSIPKTATHKDLTWELITVMLRPEIFKPWLERYGYLPTQVSIGERLTQNTTSRVPYYDDMVSMIQFGHGRPSIPEYPKITQNIKEAIDDVYYGAKEPKQALNCAAAKSAKVLGW